MNPNRPDKANKSISPRKSYWSCFHDMSHHTAMATPLDVAVSLHAMMVRRSVGPSVRRSVGPSVRRSVGPSVRRSVGPSVRRSVGPSVRRSVGPSVRRSVGQSVRRSVGPSVRRSVGPSVRRSVSQQLALVRLFLGGDGWGRLAGEGSP